MNPRAARGRIATRAGRARTGARRRPRRIEPAHALFLALLVAVHNAQLDGLSRYDISTDFPVYEQMYKWARTTPLTGYFALSTFEPLYTLASWITARAGIDFFTFIAGVKFFFVTAYFGLSKRVLPSTGWALAATVAMTATPFFTSFTENIIRQAISSSLLFLAVASLIEGRRRPFVVFSALATLFHASALIFGGLLVWAGWSRKMPPMRLLWSATAFVTVGYVVNAWSILPSVLVRAMDLVGLVYAKYGDSTALYTLGMKPLFLLASGCLALFSLSVLRRRPATRAERLTIRFGLGVTMVYMLASYLPYHDRVASVSWILIPMLGVRALQKMLLEAARTHTVRPPHALARTPSRQIPPSSTSA